MAHSGLGVALELGLGLGPRGVLVLRFDMIWRGHGEGGYWNDAAQSDRPLSRPSVQ